MQIYWSVSSKNIEKIYPREDYKQYQPKTTYIAMERIYSILKAEDASLRTGIREKGVENGYYLKVIKAIRS